jgi:uncharacterized protein YidB (DUF937 family)
MGLLDDLVGQVQSKLGPNAPTTHPDLLSTVLQLLNGAGGLQGLLQKFEQAGLGHIVQSWIGTGQNLPISPQQLQQVLGSGQVQQIAGKLGLSPDVLAQQLSHVLPHVVDGLTPNGQMPAGDVLGGALGALKKLL